MNIALKFDIINSQKVILINALKQTMEKTSEKEYTEKSAIKCKSIDKQTNRIHW